MIDLGFACAATVDDGNDVGELIFFPGQLDWILNIDKSEVTTDGTSNLVGGWPVTRWVGTVSGTVSRDSPGAKLLTNRSGYSATFIGGSTMSGWPVPSHFQVKSLTQLDEKKKLMKRCYIWYVCSRFGFDELTTRGVTANSNKKAGMDTGEFCKYIEDYIILYCTTISQCLSSTLLPYK